jgi:hypothetical protein
MVVFERGTRAAPGAGAEGAGTAHVLVRQRTGSGQSLYLNLTPLAYDYFPYRAGEMGRAWRDVIGTALVDAGLRPRVEIYGVNAREPWMEALLWRNGTQYCLAILKNLALSAGGDHVAAMLADGSAREPKGITIRFNMPATAIRNVRTGKPFGSAATIRDDFKPWEANLYEFILGR